MEKKNDITEVERLVLRSEPCLMCILYSHGLPSSVSVFKIVGTGGPAKIEKSGFYDLLYLPSNPIDISYLPLLVLYDHS